MSGCPIGPTKIDQGSFWKKASNVRVIFHPAVTLINGRGAKRTPPMDPWADGEEIGGKRRRNAGLSNSREAPVRQWQVWVSLEGPLTNCTGILGLPSLPPV